MCKKIFRIMFSVLLILNLGFSNAQAQSSAFEGEDVLKTENGIWFLVEPIMKTASDHLIPFTNCLLASFLMKETYGLSAGCLVGAIVGFVDEASLGNCFQNYFFTSALIGANLFGPSKSGIMAGATLGSAIALNVLNPISAANIASNAPLGIVLAKALSIAALSAKNHLGIDANLDIPHGEVATGIVFASILAGESMKELSSHSSLELSTIPALSSFFEKFNRDGRYSFLLKKQVTAMLGSVTIDLRFRSFLWAGIGKLLDGYQQIKTKPAEGWDEIKTQIPMVCFHVLALTVLDNFFTSLQTRLHESVVYSVKDDLESKYFSEEDLLTLSTSNDTNHLIRHIDRDFDALRSSAASLLVEEIKNKIGMIYHSNSMYRQNALDLYFVVFCYNKAVEKVTSTLISLSTEKEKEVNKIASQQSNLLNDGIDNAELIILNKQLTSLSGKKKGMNSEEQRIRSDQKLISNVLETWVRVKGFSDFLIPKIFLAYKIHKGTISFDNGVPLHKSSEDISKSLSWTSTNGQKIGALKVSLKNIETIAAAIGLSQADNCDSLKHRYVQGNEIALKLENIRVYDASHSHSLNIPFLQFAKGFYSVRGLSGSGKSTLMKKIWGLQNDDVCAEGLVTFETPLGEQERPYMITQNFHSLPESSLFEIVNGKGKDQISDLEYTKIKKRMVELFQEIEIDELAASGKGLIDELDLVKDWNSPSALSGGQRKKVAAVALILAVETYKNKFVIIDEVFAGLDRYRSLPIIKSMLKKYLADAVVLMIDHDAPDFFDQELYFVDGTATLQSISHSDNGV